MLSVFNSATFGRRSNVFQCPKNRDETAPRNGCDDAAGCAEHVRIELQTGNQDLLSAATVSAPDRQDNVIGVELHRC